MQIADRFHLHQNLLDAVKEAMKKILPNEIPIPNDYGALSENNETKNIDFVSNIPDEKKSDE